MEHSKAFLKLVDDAKKRIREISVAETLERLEDSEEVVHLIDVREDNEWQTAHAAGATHLSRGILERDIEQFIPEKGAEIILYCGGGYRSALAAESLLRMGYYDVSSMAGGWKAWKEAEAPIEKA